MSTERRDHWKEKLSESREALFAFVCPHAEGAL